MIDVLRVMQHGFPNVLFWRTFPFVFTQVRSYSMYVSTLLRLSLHNSHAHTTGEMHHCSPTIAPIVTYP